MGSPDLQRQWLDEFGGETILKQRQKTLARAFESATQAKRKLDQRRRAEQETARKNWTCCSSTKKKLEQADLDDPEELDNLIQENQRLSHTVELQQNSYQVYQILYESDSEVEACADLLGKAESILVDMEQYDGENYPHSDHGQRSPDPGTGSRVGHQRLRFCGRKPTPSGWRKSSSAAPAQKVSAVSTVVLCRS